MTNDITMPPPTTSRRRDWLVPLGLTVLGIGPVFMGLLRLSALAADRATLSDDARLAAHPMPLVLHIVAGTAFCLLGAWQFSPRLRRRPWHRVVGRALAPLGIVTALAGMWLAVAAPPPVAWTSVLGVVRVAAGATMLVFIVLGLGAVARRDFAAHGAWMTRAYALALGAGTQTLIGLPLVLLLDASSGIAFVLILVAGWAINLAVAERSLRRKASPTFHRDAPWSRA